jgi:hypothetical protein
MAFEAILSGVHYNARELDQKVDMDVNYNIPSIAEWRKCPPLLSCWMKFLRSLDTTEGLSPDAIEAVYALSVGSLQFCMKGDR